MKLQDCLELHTVSDSPHADIIGLKNKKAGQLKAIDEAIRELLEEKDEILGQLGKSDNSDGVINNNPNE